MNRRLLLTALGAALFVGLTTRPAQAQHHHGDDDHDAGAAAAGLPNCPIMDEPVNLAISVATKTGPVYFCCDGCIPKYERNPDKYGAKVAAQRVALANRPKTQVTCPVTGEPVDPDLFVEHNGQKVYVCCKGCIGKYQRDPGKYASALANSYTFQTKCPVMGGDIDPGSFTKLSTGETIYYCCPGCDKKLRTNPSQYNDNLLSQGIVVDWDEVKKADDRKGHDDHDLGSHKGHQGHSGHGHRDDDH